MDDDKWFPRFAEIPGIRYVTPQNLDSSSLPNRGKIPEISHFDFDGKRHKSIMWKYGDMTTSASPAKEWKTVPRSGESEATTVFRQIYETLELPGMLSDYHFALQNAHGELDNYTTEESWVLPEIERLCWLNIHLVEKYPETISYENDDGVNYARMTAFGRLISLYEDEGYLRDALDVAKIAVKFDSRDDVVERLKERINLLETEDRYV